MIVNWLPFYTLYCRMDSEYLLMYKSEKWSPRKDRNCIPVFFSLSCRVCDHLSVRVVWECISVYLSHFSGIGGPISGADYVSELCSWGREPNHTVRRKRREEVRHMRPHERISLLYQNCVGSYCSYCVCDWKLWPVPDVQTWKCVCVHRGKKRQDANVTTAGKDYIILDL